YFNTLNNCFNSQCYFADNNLLIVLIGFFMGKKKLICQKNNRCKIIKKSIRKTPKVKYLQDNAIKKIAITHKFHQKKAPNR
ncbi:hypothetical protein, partial [Providencia sp. JGM181]|uniref:hypothetical protein n=1 Tax=Providencia sp. JGM181 TaxID=2799799 RepID=UPI001BAD3939